MSGIFLINRQTNNVKRYYYLILPYEIYCTPEPHLVEVSVKLVLFEVVQHAAVEVFLQEVFYQGSEEPGPQSEVPRECWDSHLTPSDNYTEIQQVHYASQCYTKYTVNFLCGVYS